MGDFRGLIERLDYLNDGDPATDTDLGVTGIWLMPIMQSPSYHGYDIVDYRAVDDEYGTMEDFQALLHACHERGIRVIVDLVINHSSDEHPWFTQAAADRDAPTRDWYTWADSDPGYRGPWGQQVWHDEVLDESGQYYYGCFYHGMPDLNVRNPELTAELNGIARFWIRDMGVDGFRLDAIKHLIEDGPVQENTQASIDWLESFHAYCESLDPDHFSVGEVWSSTDQVRRYIPDAVDTAFEFDLGMSILAAINTGDASRLRASIDNTVESFADGRFATFLTNHDQARVMTELGGDRDKAKAAATILLTLPGVPFIYYGEEIGIAGGKPDPNIRTPMQWTDSPRAEGFTTGQAWRRVQRDVGAANVEDQEGRPGSLLEHYKTLIRLRNDETAMRTGDTTTHPTSHDAVLAYTRSDGSGSFLIIVNTGGEVVRDYTVDVQLPDGELIEQTGIDRRLGERDADGRWRGVMLKPRESAVLKIEYE
ncbi:MAG: alpha-amylase family glycosyl hydrolase [Phycisphaerales bacterium]